MTVSPAPAQLGQHRFGWLVVAVAAFLLGGTVVGLLYHSGVFEGSSSSGIEGSGVSTTQTRHVAAFDGVELAGSNNVVIRVGPKQMVSVTGDDNLVDRVTTEVHAGRLVVGNEPGSFSTNAPMSVDITVPELTTLKLSGSGNIVANGLGADAMSVSLPGSGTLTADGTARRLDVSVDGSGVVRFTEVVATDVRAVVSGSGSVFVTATESLDGTVSGSGAILYTGSPTNVAKNVTGSGAIVGS